MSNIIDKIRLSGVTYTLSATSAGGSPTVELTQAEYDALVSAGTVSADTYYIITDAQSVDISNYWTSAQTQSAITEATSGKASQSDVETVSGTVTAHTADTTIHVTSSDKTTWSGKQDALISGTNIKTINNESILGSGNITIQGGGGGVDSGTVQTMIDSSISGKVDTSAVVSSVTSASTDSEIPTAKAVYDAIPTGGTSITIDPSLDSGSTNPVANSAITNTVGKYYYAYKVNNSPYDNPWGSVSSNDCVGTSLTFKNIVDNSNVSSYLWLSKINNKSIFYNSNSAPNANYFNFNLVETSAITTSITSGSTDSQVPSAKAVYDQLGGLSLVKLTQSAYDALNPDYDSNTLYVIVN